MNYWLRLTYLGLFILFSSFQCSRWEKYAEDVSLEINPDKLTSVNDSVSILVEASIRHKLSQKVDSIEIDFYYLQDNGHFESKNNEIGSILLTPKQQSQSKQFKFKLFIKGKSLYAKQIVKKNKKKIKSPLLLVAE